MIFWRQSERLAQEGRLPIATREVRDTVISDIPGLPPSHPSDLPGSYLNPVLYSWMKYHHYRLGRANVILVNTFYELEHQSIDVVLSEVLGTRHVKTEHLFDIGPLSSDTDQTTIASTIRETFVEKPNPCLTWLDTQAFSSVLYLCIGSGIVNLPSPVQELAMGLESSGQSFLWILRPSDALRPGAARVISRNCIHHFTHHTSQTASTKPSPLCSGSEDRVRGRGMCYSGWAPQTRILGHPATGGFRSHSSWNSTLESLSAGVPILAWSRGADQHLNCRFLVDTAHVALPEQRKDAPSAADVENMVANPAREVSQDDSPLRVRRLMRDEQLRARMARMRDGTDATAAGGSSRRSMEAYVQHLTRQPIRIG